MTADHEICNPPANSELAPPWWAHDAAIGTLITAGGITATIHTSPLAGFLFAALAWISLDLIERWAGVR